MIRHLVRNVWHFGNRIKVKVRYWHLFLLVGKLGKGVHAFGWPHLNHPDRIEIQDGVTINEGVVLGGRGGIRLGKNVRLSNGAILETGYLHLNPESRYHAAQPIVLEENVWVASGAIILPGVTVGRNSIIAAGAVVTRDVPENSVAMGVPARSRPLGTLDSPGAR